MSLKNFEIESNKDEVTIDGKSISKKSIEKIELNYKFLVFPKLTVKFKDGNRKSFFIEKYSKDYFEIDNVIKANQNL